MNMQKISIMTLCLILFTATLAGMAVSTRAQAADQLWTVAEINGDPKYMVEEGPWQVITQDSQLPEHSIIETGKKDQLVITRGKNTISVYPNSKLQLSEPDSLMTSIIQFFGEALFQIEKRNKKHFEVKTPYMIAGVKGTSFGITVDDISASTYLLEGRVQVVDINSGRTMDLLPNWFSRATKAGEFDRRRLMTNQQRLKWINKKKKAKNAIKRIINTVKTPINKHTVGNSSLDIDLGAPIMGIDMAIETKSDDKERDAEHKSNDGKRDSKHKSYDKKRDTKKKSHEKKRDTKKKSHDKKHGAKKKASDKKHGTKKKTSNKKHGTKNKWGDKKELKS